MKTNHITSSSTVFFFFIGTLFLISCSHSVKILDVPMISMTRSAYSASNMPRLKSVGEVKGEFCSNRFSRTRIGLIDTVVKEVQEQYEIDYIKEATLSVDGKYCMEIIGEGLRIIKKDKREIHKEARKDVHKEKETTKKDSNKETKL